MKKYILTHDTFIDDLRDAAEVAAKHNCPLLADNLTKHADELRNFDIHTGWTDPLHEDNIFRLDCGDAKSSWKRWQEQAFALAKEHDGQLFTYGTISDLVNRMNESVKVFRTPSTSTSRTGSSAGSTASAPPSPSARTAPSPSSRSAVTTRRRADYDARNEQGRPG